jgi:chromate transporter
MHETEPNSLLPLAQPRSLTELFWAFTFLALQGFGGVLAVVQRELVEKRRWLSLEQFVEEWATAQIMPGPNVVNLSLMLGHRYFGLRGALVAMSGMLLAPLIVALMLSLIYRQFADSTQVQGALRGMSAVAAGLIIATGLKMISALKSNPLGRLWTLSLALATFVFIALLHVPLAYVVVTLGSLAFVICYKKLQQRRVS